MKFIHISDLHIGRHLGEYSLIEDQRAVLDSILALIRTEMPDALLIAGDIYDKTVPSAEAVGVLDDFLTAAAALTRVLLIAGNHDSPERIAFGSRLMEGVGLHVCGIYDGEVHRAVFRDAYGEVNVYLLPYLRTADVRRYLPDAAVETVDEAVGAAISALGADPDARNVLLAHQFVIGGERSESEYLSVGTADRVSSTRFSAFDYTALGHLHRAQNCTAAEGTVIRYSGSPLPYSISEADDQKSVSVVTLEEKGKVSVRVHPLTPIRRIFCLRGTYDTVMARDFYCDTPYPDSYVQITLTDEYDIPDALYRLRTVYPYLLRLEYDNTRTRSNLTPTALSDGEEMEPGRLFSLFFTTQNGADMDEDMQAYMDAQIARIFGEESVT